jgi:hypothetical protein
MSAASIYYKDGYKYQLNRDYQDRFDCLIGIAINTEYIKITEDGLIWLKRGYAWDGPSGPTIDTKSFMRASLVHDALYQLIREGHLELSKFRLLADKLMKDICQDDGMIAIRAFWVYWAVRLFAESAARPGNDRKLLVAP